MSALDQPIVRKARQDYAAFYAAADAVDRESMDCLVMVRAALRMAFDCRREGFSVTARDAIERAADATEIAFTDLREQVRSCGAFASLPPDEQERIRVEVFDVGPVRLE